VWIKKDIFYDAMLLPRPRLDYAVGGPLVLALLALICVPAASGKPTEVAYDSRARRGERARATAAEATGRGDVERDAERVVAARAKNSRALSSLLSPFLGIASRFRDLPRSLPRSPDCCGDAPCPPLTPDIAAFSPIACPENIGRHWHRSRLIFAIISRADFGGFPSR